MAIIKADVDVCSLEDIINNNEECKLKLKIPIYQRPYTWKTKTAETLLDDLLNNNSKEYRLGSLILHKYKDKDEDVYDIVDGQQRMITIAIILNILGKENNFLNDYDVKKLSLPQIKNNYIALKIVIDEFSEKTKDILYKNLMKCSFVIIVTDKIGEAFQFFDSQNSRGKPLKPHDLLKAYHLREMNDLEEVLKNEIVRIWDSVDEDILAEFFRNYLYPIIKWSKEQNGLHYSSSKIDTFKGISNSIEYNFNQYKAQITKLFKNTENNIEADNFIFQINGQMINGEYFFKYTNYYLKKLEEIKKKFKENFSDEERPDNYTNRLLICVLMFYADRFGDKYLEKDKLDKIYEWSYALRLASWAIRETNINTYANNRSSALKNGAIFSEINKMVHHNKILDINIKKEMHGSYNTELRRKKYAKVIEKLGFTENINE